MTAGRIASRAGVAIALLLLLGVALSVGGAIWILNSDRGTAWSLAQAQRFVPALTVSAAEGSWRRGVRAARIVYTTETMTITVEDLELAFQLSAWRRALVVSRLAARQVHIEQQPEPQAEAEPLSLPQVSLPLAITVEALDVRVLRYERATTNVAVSDLRAQLAMEGSEVRWRDLRLTWEGRKLATSGWLLLEEHYPLQADIQIEDQALDAHAAVALSGDLGDFRLYAETAGPAAVLLEAGADLLDPALPFWAEAQLAQPLAFADGAVTLDATDVTLEGRLAAADGSLAATLLVPGYDAVAVAIPLQWREPQLAFQPRVQLGPGGSQGSIAIDCELSTSEPLPLMCNGEISRISLAPLMQVAQSADAPAAAGTDPRTGAGAERWLAGQISSELQLDVASWQPLAITLTLPALEGSLAGAAIAGSVAVTGDGATWQVDDSSLAIGENSLRVSGRLGERSDLEVTVTAPTLRQLHPQLAGALVATANIQGALINPDIQIDAEGEGLRWGEETRLGTLVLAARVASLGEAPSELTLSATRAAVAGTALASAEVRATGTLERHQLALTAADLADHADIRFGCTGESTPSFAQWQLVCSEGNVQLELAAEPWQWRLTDPLRLDWASAAGSLQIHPFCLSSDDGDLCLTKSLRWRDGNLSGAFAATDVALDRIAQLPGEDTLQLENRPRASAQVDLMSFQPLRLAAEATISPSTWRWQTPDGPQQGSLESVELTLTANDDKAELSMATGGPELGSLRAYLTVAEPLGARRLDGRIALEALELEPFGWIAPELQWQGTVNTDIAVGGSFAAPVVNGRLQLRDGMLQVPNIGQPIEEVALTIDFDLDTAEIDGRFTLAPGGGRIAGTLVLPRPDQPWRLALAVTGDDLQVQPLPGSTIRFDPDLALAASPERVEVTGRIAVEQAEIRLKALPPDTADVSADAEWVNSEEAAQAPLDLYADIRLDLGSRTSFEGFGAELQLRGDLRMRHTPRLGLRLQGEVQVPDGRYRAYGQRLQVRRGTLLFTGPPGNPELNLEAIREMPPTVHDQVAGIRILGPLQNPSAQLFAEPSMPESDIAYFLLTGRMRPTDGSGGEISATGALLTLGLAGTGDQTAELAERFGISEFEIGTRETATGTEATVSGYLTPRLYVRYGTGLRERVNSITFQYRLTPNLVLEAISGVEEALDLLYSFTID